MTTAQRDALPGVVNGMEIYNTTTKQKERREEGAWRGPSWRNGAFRINGAGGDSGTFTAAGVPVQMYASNDTSIPFQKVFTPDYSCWWPVDAMALVRVTDAAWYRINFALVLSPADADGATTYIASIMHHVGAADYDGRLNRAQWKLAAGTTYTCSMQITYVSGGTWVYHKAQAHSWMQSSGAIER